MKVYLSEYGKVTELEHIKDTPKGYRVRGYFKKFNPKRETIVLRKHPQGCHAAFLTEQEAVYDAIAWISYNESRAWDIIERMEKKLQELPSVTDA